MIPDRRTKNIRFGDSLGEPNGRPRAKLSREFFSTDPVSGEPDDSRLHAELLGDDECSWDLDLGPLDQMSDAEAEAYIEGHCLKYYGSGSPSKP